MCCFISFREVFDIILYHRSSFLGSAHHFPIAGAVAADPSKQTFPLQLSDVVFNTINAYTLYVFHKVFLR